MRLMKHLKHWLAAASIGLVAFSVAATPTEPVEGMEYHRLQTPQPTDTGKKNGSAGIFLVQLPTLFCV